MSSSESNLLLDAALAYAARGWQVFPVWGMTEAGCACPSGSSCHRPGKHPRARWQTEATSDPERIKTWFRPTDNIGIATGERSGISVVDVDPAKGGLDSVAKLITEHGEGFLDTYTAETGGDGNHLYYQYALGLGCSVSLLAPGIDVRSDGGYVVAAPSLHASGKRYSVVSDVPLASAPGWVAALAQAKPTKRESAGGVAPDAREDKQTIEEIRDKLTRLTNPSSQALIDECLAGRSFARVGERDGTLQRIASIVAYVAPDKDPTELATAILYDSLATFEPDDAGRYTQDDRVAWAAEKIARAQEDARRDRELEELQNARIARGLGLNKPKIVVSDNERERVATEAVKALGGLGETEIAVRGGALVRVIQDRGNLDWLNYPNGTPVIQYLPEPSLAELMERSAHWVRNVANKVKAGEEQTFTEISVAVPAWAVKLVMNRGEWPGVRQLMGISHAPILAADGSIHDEPGYDPKTRMIYDPRGKLFPAIPKSPTRADAIRAYEELTEPLCDFAFVDPCHKSAMISAVLSLVGRAAFDTCPVHAFNAARAGEGKTLAGQAAVIMATGSEAPTTDNVDDTEWGKRLIAMLASNPSSIFVDNVKLGERFGCPPIARVLTSPEISGRLLQVSKDVKGVLTSVWFVTGCNLQYASDMRRRRIEICIDQGVERPEKSTGFKYDPLKTYLKREHPRLVCAALTLLKAFIDAGMPRHGKSPKNSFGEWDALIRGAIIWVGGSDPEDSVERATDDDADEEDANLRKLAAAWETSIGIDAPKTIREACLVASRRTDLLDALKPYGTDYKGDLDPGRISQDFKKIQRRVCDGKKFVKSDIPGKVIKWVLVTASPNRPKAAGSLTNPVEAKEAKEGIYNSNEIRDDITKDGLKEENRNLENRGDLGMSAGSPPLPPLPPIAPTGQRSVEAALAARGELKHVSQEVLRRHVYSNG